ncbi:O-antigen ligase domain-containing protein, partial [Streptomyces mirabilis]
ALLRPPSLQRACAIFLISYCAIASYTEAGLGDASPYLLHLALAASLLAAPAPAAPLSTPEVPRRHIPRWAQRSEVT